MEGWYEDAGPTPGQHTPDSPLDILIVIVSMALAAVVVWGWL